MQCDQLLRDVEAKAGPAETAARKAETVSDLQAGMLYGEKCTECHYRNGAPNVYVAGGQL